MPLAVLYQYFLFLRKRHCTSFHNQGHNTHPSLSETLVNMSVWQSRAITVLTIDLTIGYINLRHSYGRSETHFALHEFGD